MEELSINKRQSTIFYKGFGIIEAVVGIALASMLLTAFMTLTVQTIKINRANINELKADMYLKELIEVAKDLEQSEDWSVITGYPCSDSLNQACHPEISGGKWTLVPGTESLDNNMYSRSLTIADVNRNQIAFPNEIVASGGIFDPNTKKIIGEIRWNDGTHSPMTLETYVYNYNTP